MTLNSLLFFGCFLGFLLILFVSPKRFRRWLLLAGNIAFYLFSDHIWGWLLLVTAVFVWCCALAPERFGKKKLWLTLGILWNAGLLLSFRFFGGNFSGLMPLGLSFYTLRCISYLADVYRGKISPVHSFWDLLIWIIYFPQVISGPIERPEPFMRELHGFEQKSLWNFERLRNGFLLYLWGVFQKIILAERLSGISRKVFTDFSDMGFWPILLGTFAYTLQIFCDFNAYSDMSRGISDMLGIRTMLNFRRPYFAVGIRDFWHRWHISLSTWLTDYIYIPLGGNRHGTIRKYLNIIAVYAVSGFWHGPTLNFLFWGLLHAAYQIIEDLWHRYGKPLPRIFSRILTLGAVNFAWIFFNAGGLNRGIRMVRQMFRSFAPIMVLPGIDSGNAAVLLIGLLMLLVTDILRERGVSVFRTYGKLSPILRALICAVFIWLVILFGIYGVGYDTSGFIYAQF